MELEGFLRMLLLIGILQTTTGEAKRKHKKFGHYIKPQINSNEELKEEMEIIAMMERDEIAKEAALAENDESFFEKDPCYKTHCGPGKVCRILEGKASCLCIEDCPVEIDPRRKVCSNFNETWDSDCALHQMRCWCQRGDEKCLDKKALSHAHIEYYGECREMEKCTEDQMADFPRRMRDWLFNVMRDLADREELSPYYMKVEQEAELETNLTKKWTKAAVWKWCDLEKNHDRGVSRHELFPIRAHLMALEHCIAPFLDGCDSDDNHNITLQEWAKCLEIFEDDIEETCEDIRESAKE